MSAEKRPASNAFGSTQMVVKRQKSDANLGSGSAVTVVNGTATNGALIQSVSLTYQLISSKKCSTESNAWKAG